MATTKIWAVKDNLKRVLDYASNPEKTENTDFEKYTFKGLEDVLDYTTDDMKTEKQFYLTGINCDSINALWQMTNTKKSAHKEDGVLAFHCYQSFKPGEVTAETAHQIGIELAKRMWGDDFEVVVSTHLDKKHFHNHFVVNSVSWTTRKRFLNKHKDYAKFRMLSDELCKQYSLSVIKNPKKGKHYAEWRAERQHIPTRRSLIIDDVERAINQSMTFTQFIKNMKAMDYEVKTNVKYIAVKLPGADGFFRLHKLTKNNEYSEESIKERILNNHTVYINDFSNHKYTVMKYHGNHKNAKKLTGIKALYFHYMYRMGIIKKHAPHKRVHFLLKEDLRYIDRISKEATILVKNKINTIEELEVKQDELNEKLNNLLKERRCYYNKVSRCKNPETKKLLEQDVAALSNEIKQIRKEVRLYDDIKKRSTIMKDKLVKVKEDEQRKESKQHGIRRNRRSNGKDVTAGN